MTKNSSDSSKINKIKVISTSDEKLKPGVEIVYMLMKQDAVTLMQILNLLNKLGVDVKDIKQDVKDLKSEVKVLHKRIDSVVKVNNLKE